MDELFPSQFLGGIGLFILWGVMLCSLGWALIFRLGAAFAKR